MRERGNVPVTSFKPGHTLLILLGLLVFGLHDYASFAVSAILGTLTVFLLYRLTSRMFRPEVALLAGLILAVSPFHVGYSRSGLAQANSVFFVVLGLYLWYLAYQEDAGCRRRLLLAGCAIGFAFTCHFNLFIMPPILIAFQAITSQEQPMLERAKRLSLLCGGMALPLLMFELPARALRAFDVLPQGQLTYFEQYFYRGTLASRLHLSFEGASAFLEKIFLSEGALILAAVSIAIVLTIMRLRSVGFESKLVLSLFLIPALPWSTLSVGLVPYFRTFPVTSLALSILAALSFFVLSSLLKLLPRVRPIAYPLVFLIVLCNGLYHVKNLLPLRSTYHEATATWLDYVDRQGGRISFFPGSVWPIWYFYLSTRYDELPARMKQHVQFYPGLKDAIPPQGDFEAIDIKRYFRCLIAEKPHLLAYFDRVRETHHPIVRVHNPVSEMPFAYFESGGQEIKGILNDLSQIPAANYIEIFDLRPAHNLNRDHRPISSQPITMGSGPEQGGPR